MRKQFKAKDYFYHVKTSRYSTWTLEGKELTSFSIPIISAGGGGMFPTPPERQKVTVHFKDGSEKVFDPETILTVDMKGKIDD